MIFAAYEALIAGSAMDPADRISAAALRLDPAFLADKAVFIDNFDGFTAPEYRMLEKLVEAEECTVTLCCDGLSDNEAGLGLFSPVKKTAQNLRRIAGKQSVEIAAPHVMQEDFRHKNAPGLAAVNQCLAFGAPEAPEHAGLFCHACRRCLRRVQGRSLPHRPRLCANGGCATAALRSSAARWTHTPRPCNMNLLWGIPYFRDETTSPEHTAPAAFLRRRCRCCRKGFPPRRSCACSKLDLCGFAPEEIAVLENYAYTWQLKAADWRAPFEKNPAGFGAQMTDEDRAALARAEALRAEVSAPCGTLSGRGAGTDGSGHLQQLYLLLDAFSGAEHTAQAAAAFEQAGDRCAPAHCTPLGENMMDLLGQMEQLWAGKR